MSFEKGTLARECVIEPERQERMQEILDLALQLHGSTEGHREYTFQSIKDHSDEIRMLQLNGDNHWKAETADLLIHGLLLLKDSGVSANEVDQLIDRRLGRFREKITDALRAKEQNS